MSDFSGKDGQRTKYSATIELTARELWACKAFYEHPKLPGVQSLAAGIIMRVAGNAEPVATIEDTITKADPGPPSTDLHRE